MIEKHTQRQEQRRRRIRAQFFKLPDLAKTDLWQKAVARNLVKDGDPLAMQILPTLIPFMFGEFEEAILNNSAPLGNSMNANKGE